MADLPAQIGEIEAQIECLSEATHNCRKIAVAAQVAAAGGGLILISMSLGVLRFPQKASSSPSRLSSVASLSGARTGARLMRRRAGGYPREQAGRWSGRLHHGDCNP